VVELVDEGPVGYATADHIRLLELRDVRVGRRRRSSYSSRTRHGSTRARLSPKSKKKQTFSKTCCSHISFSPAEQVFSLPIAAAQLAGKSPA